MGKRPGAEGHLLTEDDMRFYHGNLLTHIKLCPCVNICYRLYYSVIQLRELSVSSSSGVREKYREICSGAFLRSRGGNSAVPMVGRPGRR